MPFDLQFPILSHFFCTVEMSTGLPPQPLDATAEQRVRAQDDDKAKTLPKGVVLGPDGKPYVNIKSKVRHIAD
jgi:FAD-linked sulfhydryl oxidase